MRPRNATGKKKAALLRQEYCGEACARRFLFAGRAAVPSKFTRLHKDKSRVCERRKLHACERWPRRRCKKIDTCIRPQADRGSFEEAVCRAESVWIRDETALPTLDERRAEAHESPGGRPRQFR